MDETKEAREERMRAAERAHDRLFEARKPNTEQTASFGLLAMRSPALAA